MTNDTASISVAINIPNTQLGNATIDKSTKFTLPLPTKIDGNDINKIQTDFELFLQAVKNDPSSIGTLFEAVGAGDEKITRQYIDKLGFSENSFQAQGGGWLWIVVAGAVLLYGSIAK